MLPEIPTSASDAFGSSRQYTQESPISATEVSCCISKRRPADWLSAQKKK